VAEDEQYAFIREIQQFHQTHSCISTTANLLWSLLSQSCTSILNAVSRKGLGVNQWVHHGCMI
jgi:hypothetical protein